MDFNFYMPVQVFTGEGCVKQQMARMSRYGRRCLILTGTHSATASGALDDVMETLTAAGVDAHHFSGNRPEPPAVSMSKRRLCRPKPAGRISSWASAVAP